MTEELLYAAYDTLDEIKNLKEYQEMLILKKKIQNDLRNVINDFQLAKADVEKASYNKYSNEFKDACQKLSEIKTELYTNSLVISYRENEKKVQKYLDEIMDGLIKTARGEELWENNQKEK